MSSFISFASSIALNDCLKLISPLEDETKSLIYTCEFLLCALTPFQQITVITYSVW